MAECYTCRVLRSKIEQARRNREFEAVREISQEMSDHYAAYHQPREAQEYPELPGSEKLFGQRARVGR